MEFRETVVAGADQGRPDWYVPPVGGEFVETRRSRDLRERLESLSRTDRRVRLRAVEAAFARREAPGADGAPHPG